MDCYQARNVARAPTVIPTLITAKPDMRRICQNRRLGTFRTSRDVRLESGMGSESPRNRARRANQSLSHFSVESRAQKYFASRSPQIKLITLAVSSLTRGVSRSSRTLG